ncbi:MAG: hypothetical protein IJ730_05570 [Alphaproteobacteria bacterium]|nr:hypothetical protein [Alphaproteobacteria bacterium]
MKHIIFTCCYTLPFIISNNISATLPFQNTINSSNQTQNSFVSRESGRVQNFQSDANFLNSGNAQLNHSSDQKNFSNLYNSNQNPLNRSMIVGSLAQLPPPPPPTNNLSKTMIQAQSSSYNIDKNPLSRSMIAIPSSQLPLPPVISNIINSINNNSINNEIEEEEEKKDGKKYSAIDLRNSYLPLSKFDAIIKKHTPFYRDFFLNPYLLVTLEKVDFLTLVQDKEKHCFCGNIKNIHKGDQAFLLNLICNYIEMYVYKKPEIALEMTQYFFHENGEEKEYLFTLDGKGPFKRPLFYTLLGNNMTYFFKIQLLYMIGCSILAEKEHNPGYLQRIKMAVWPYVKKINENYSPNGQLKAPSSVFFANTRGDLFYQYKSNDFLKALFGYNDINGLKYEDIERAIDKNELIQGRRINISLGAKISYLYMRTFNELGDYKNAYRSGGKFFFNPYVIGEDQGKPKRILLMADIGFDLLINLLEQYMFALYKMGGYEQALNAATFFFSKENGSLCESVENSNAYFDLERNNALLYLGMSESYGLASGIGTIWANAFIRLHKTLFTNCYNQNWLDMVSKNEDVKNLYNFLKKYVFELPAQKEMTNNEVAKEKTVNDGEKINEPAASSSSIDAAPQEELKENVKEAKETNSDEKKVSDSIENVVGEASTVEEAHKKSDVDETETKEKTVNEEEKIKETAASSSSIDAAAQEELKENVKASIETNRFKNEQLNYNLYKFIFDIDDTKLKVSNVIDELNKILEHTHGVRKRNNSYIKNIDSEEAKLQQVIDEVTDRIIEPEISVRENKYYSPAFNLAKEIYNCDINKDIYNCDIHAEIVQYIAEVRKQAEEKKKKQAEEEKARQQALLRGQRVFK